MTWAGGREDDENEGLLQTVDWPSTRLAWLVRTADALLAILAAPGIRLIHRFAPPRCPRHAPPLPYLSELCPLCNGDRVYRADRTDARSQAHPDVAPGVVGSPAERVPGFDLAAVHRAVRASRRNDLHRHSDDR